MGYYIGIVNGLTFGQFEGTTAGKKVDPTVVYRKSIQENIFVTGISQEVEVFAFYLKNVYVTVKGFGTNVLAVLACKWLIVNG